VKQVDVLDPLDAWDQGQLVGEQGFVQEPEQGLGQRVILVLGDIDYHHHVVAYSYYTHPKNDCLVLVVEQDFLLRLGHQLAEDGWVQCQVVLGLLVLLEH
jgi:hypothetical protein